MWIQCSAIVVCGLLLVASAAGQVRRRGGGDRGGARRRRALGPPGERRQRDVPAVRARAPDLPGVDHEPDGGQHHHPGARQGAHHPDQVPVVHLRPDQQAHTHRGWTAGAGEPVRVDDPAHVRRPLLLRRDPHQLQVPAHRLALRRRLPADQDDGAPAGARPRLQHGDAPPGPQDRARAQAPQLLGRDVQQRHRAAAPGQGGALRRGGAARLPARHGQVLLRHGRHRDGLGRDAARRQHQPDPARGERAHHEQQGVPQVQLRLQQDHRQHAVRRLPRGQEGLLPGRQRRPAAHRQRDLPPHRRCRVLGRGLRQAQVPRRLRPGQPLHDLDQEEHQGLVLLRPAGQRLHALPRDDDDRGPHHVAHDLQQLLAGLVPRGLPVGTPTEPDARVQSYLLCFCFKLLFLLPVGFSQ